MRKFINKLKNLNKRKIRHDRLREIMQRINELEDYSQETSLRFFNELRHSNLIIAGKLANTWGVNPAVIDVCMGKFGMLFTDFDEFLKAFPDMWCKAYENPFSEYLAILENQELDGFIINCESEFFLLNKDLTDLMNPLPEKPFSVEKSYKPFELKRIRDSINNSSLEEFINDPANIGNYEGLFDVISTSALFGMAISPDDLTGIAYNGIISLERKPLVSPYIVEDGGIYGTAFTCEDKFENVQTPFNRYSHIINFWIIVSYMLKYEADGIIINPNSENVLITRDVLLQYSDYIKEKCYDKRMNSAELYIFLMGEKT